MASIPSRRQSRSTHSSAYLSSGRLSSYSALAADPYTLSASLALSTSGSRLSTPKSLPSTPGNEIPQRPRLSVSSLAQTRLIRRRASCPSLSIQESLAENALKPSPHRRGTISKYTAAEHETTTRRSSKASIKLPPLPGLLPMVMDIPTETSDNFLSYWNEKILHQRGKESTLDKRDPMKKITRIVERTQQNVRVIRVGGGYLILSDELQQYYAYKAMQRLLRTGQLDEFNGVKVAKRLADGTIILQDGSKILPDGTRTFANGLQLRADGAWVDADGNVITDADRIAELNQAYGTMPLRPDTTQSIRSNFLGSARSRMSPPDSLASTQRRSASRLGQGQSSNMNASSRHGGERDNNSGTKSDPLSSVVEVDADNTRSLPPSRRMHWDFDSEVVTVLPDGTKVLADGTKIHADGSITLADGTQLTAEEGQELARKRKLGRWPKQLKKKGNGATGSDGQNSDNPSSRSSRRHSRQDSIDGISGLKLDVGRTADGTGTRGGDLESVADDESDDPRYTTARRRRLGRLADLDPFEVDAGPEVRSLLKIRPGHVNALDYLSRYCILTQEQLRQYRIVFDNLDRDKDGEISHVELEFGVKTVNKHVITTRELEYVNVVLEVQQARAITFRMFAIISALSERVVGLDLFVRNLINAMDAHALAQKIIGCKSLFYILDEKRCGHVGVDDLSNELIAGRISKEHEEIIIDKFTEDGKEEVDFLDFLTYIPLFVEIHDTINSNPFNTTRDK
eukprot:m.168970 g.168970  ORF g.168970 m.168970 type:complete len:741 (-) comp16468_c7_seq11:524-2746(-)